MKNKFVKTNNVIKMIGALGELEKKKHQMKSKGLALIHGHPGYGKTEACHWYAVQHNAVYVRACAVWTASAMLRKIATDMELEECSSGAANFNNIKEGLKNNPRSIFVDEADYIVRDWRMLETLRDLQDTTGTPIVLIGMVRIADAIARKFPQFWSRISQNVEFTPLSAEDVQIIGAELADLSLPVNIAGQIQRQTGGNFRQTVVLLSHLETMCKTNKAEVSEKIVEMAARGLRAVG